MMLNKRAHCIMITPYSHQSDLSKNPSIISIFYTIVLILAVFFID